ncbi:hypothetical protein [Massilia sp. erpn]|uniref:hypothetical protein n=1 Tax=Massilia sp. erpn TaxID=2738142 RepID=UPI0021061884|nr:hypothetical protein [Massilia sp. erpn]UTY55881.1 hypothetical protein HPQ68_00970 [Massilia sp. erpn]
MLAQTRTRSLKRLDGPTGQAPPLTFILANMKEHLPKLFTAMDEKLWLRMLVCFLPGLILGKLAGQHPGLIMGLLGTGSLILGITLFFLWPRLRSLVAGDDGDAAGEPAATAAAAPHAAAPRPGMESAQLMDELQALCGDSGAQAIAAVQTELMVNPKLSYAEAIELAHRRKGLESGRQ